MMNRIRRILSAVMAMVIIMTGIPFGFAEEGQMIELTPEQIAELTMPEEMAIEEPAVEEVSAEKEDPTVEATIEVTPEPTIEMTTEPTAEPVDEPTVEVEATLEPIPTEEPTTELTPEITPEVSVEPTVEPSVEPSTEPTVEPTTEPTEELLLQTAQELAAWFGLELWEIAEAFEMTEEELLVLPAEEIAVLYAQIQEMLGEVATMAASEFEIDKNGVLKKYNGNAEHVIIPDGVLCIAWNAFGNAREVKRITFSASVEKVEEHSFTNCSSLESIKVVPQNQHFKDIDGVLYSKDGFTLVRYPKSMSKTEFVIPDGVTTIKSYAFMNTNWLEKITISKNVDSIEPEAFKGVFGLKSFDVNNDNRFFKSVDGILFTKDGKTLVCYPCARFVNKYSIPSGVTTIGAYAFEDTYMDYITIPSTLTRIERNAFTSCSYLKEINVPYGVVYIGIQAFDYCENLESIAIPSTVEKIEDLAFGDPYMGTNTITVYCEAGSYVEEYCKKNDVPYKTSDWVQRTISFTSPADQSEVDAGSIITVNWDGSYSDNYIVNVKLLDGSPDEGNINESGTSLIPPESKQNANSITFTVPENAGGKYIKVHVQGFDNSGKQTETGYALYLKVKKGNCEHLNHANDTYLETEYRNINNVDVHEKRDVYTHSCTDCGEQLPNIYTDWVNEAHEDDGNGFCWKCKATVVCEHNEQEKREIGEPEYAQVNAEKHEKIISYQMYCTECKESVGEVFTATTEEKHHFEDGVCCCGFEQPALLITGKDKLVVKQSATLTVKDANGKTISNKNLTWSVEDKTIADIKAGKVTAKKEGQTTITATAKDGSTGSIVITVYPKATGITIYRGEEALANNATIAIDLSSEQKTCELRAVVMPETAIQDVTWKSSSAKVAKVDANGVVTALKAGSATITATTTDGSKKSAKVKISVGYNAQEITISGATELAAGKSTTLKTTVIPSNATNKGVTWVSSDTKLATVNSSGKVTAAKKVNSRQSVIITATAKDGSGVFAQHEIWIVPQVNKIVLKDENGQVLSNSAEINLSSDNPTLVLTAEVVPEGASGAVSWSSSSTKIAKVSTDGTVTALKKGTVTITAKAKDGSNKSVKVTIKVVDKPIPTSTPTVTHTPKPTITPTPVPTATPDPTPDITIQPTATTPPTDFQYEIIRNNFVRITDYFGNDQNVVIPSLIEGLPVTEISRRAFNQCKSMTSISLPGSLTYLERYAFNGCSNLTNVILPDSLTSIEDGVFKDCISLTSITLPDSITSLGSFAFSGCGNLTNVTLPDNLTLIGEYAFYECTSLSNITLPDSLDTIENHAFARCPSLTSITLPNSISSMEGYVFYECTSLSNITLPDSLTYIDSSVFENCTCLKAIDLPDTLTSIGNGAFAGCTSLTNIDLPDNITFIEGGVFAGCSSLNNITLPDSLTSIGYGAFKNCSNLTTIILPDSLTFIDTSTFMGCSSLTNITLPDSLTTVESYLFIDCTNLKNIDLPEGITSIGYRAFENCTSLTNVELPDRITSISLRAFAGCSNLISIELPDSIVTIEQETFYDCSSLISIELPNNLTSIGWSAFEGCSSLTSIKLPNTLTTIKNDAFENCSSLINIGFPISLSSIGYSAFHGCNNLTSIDLPNSITSIPGDTFNGCSNLISIVIPPSVEEIGLSAFFGIPRDNCTIYGEVGSYAETYANKEGFIFKPIDDFKPIVLPSLDMSFAKLDKNSYAPGDTITISGIRVKNAHTLHISGDVKGVLKDVPCTYSESFREITTSVTLPDWVIPGNYYISLTARNTATGAESELHKVYYTVGTDDTTEIISVQFTCNDAIPQVGKTFTLTVVTNDQTKKLRAVNNTGTGFKNPDAWTTSQNANGTITWTRSYIAEDAIDGRYWIVTPYNANDVAGKVMESNRIDIAALEYRVWYMLNEKRDEGKFVTDGMIQLTSENIGDRISIYLSNEDGSQKWHPSDNNNTSRFYYEVKGDEGVLSLLPHAYQGDILGAGEISVEIWDSEKNEVVVTVRVTIGSKNDVSLIYSTDGMISFNAVSNGIISVSKETKDTAIAFLLLHRDSDGSSIYYDVGKDDWSKDGYKLEIIPGEKKDALCSFNGTIATFTSYIDMTYRIVLWNRDKNGEKTVLQEFDIEIKWAPYVLREKRYSLKYSIPADCPCASSSSDGGIILFPAWGISSHPIVNVYDKLMQEQLPWNDERFELYVDNDYSEGSIHNDYKKTRELIHKTWGYVSLSLKVDGENQEGIPIYCLHEKDVEEFDETLAGPLTPVTWFVTRDPSGDPYIADLCLTGTGGGIFDSNMVSWIAYVEYENGAKEIHNIYPGITSHLRLAYWRGDTKITLIAVSKFREGLYDVVNWKYFETYAMQYYREHNYRIRELSEEKHLKDMWNNKEISNLTWQDKIMMNARDSFKPITTNAINLAENLVNYVKYGDYSVGATFDLMFDLKGFVGNSLYDIPSAMVSTVFGLNNGTKKIRGTIDFVKFLYEVADDPNIIKLFKDGILEGGIPLNLIFEFEDGSLYLIDEDGAKITRAESFISEETIDDILTLNDEISSTNKKINLVLELTGLKDAIDNARASY